ncbi:MAG: hypothetical protein AAF485_20575 [Chloroflexota bacterium]
MMISRIIYPLFLATLFSILAAILFVSIADPIPALPSQKVEQTPLQSSQNTHLQQAQSLTFSTYLPILLGVGSGPNISSPTLLSPLNSSYEIAPEFTWTDVASATKYQFQLAKTSAFTDVLVDQILVSSSYTLSSYADGTYYWRVAAANDTIGSSYSEFRALQLISLITPTLLSPAEGALADLPTFDWADVLGATHYQFQLATTDAFTDSVLDLTVETSAYTLTTRLDGVHYWRVYARKGSFNGPYSDVRSIQLLPLEAPTLLTPAPGTPQAEPQFDWTDVASATSYQFQLATTSAFTDAVISQTVTNSNHSFASVIDGLYYWRVVAQNGAQYSPPSQVWAAQLVNYNADTDGDSLPNGWELHGYDADNDDVIDVDLPTLGANYQHKDLFVEMDYMERVTATNGLAPNQAVIDRLVTMFNNAPISNTDGISGITLHLDLDDLVPHDPSFSWDGGNVNEFYALKAAHFDTPRTAIYHYMIWADTYANHTSTEPFVIGYSRKVPGVDFFVTLGSFENGAGGTDDHKVSAFAHELGHNLGLFHGGTQTTNRKPNYLSLMNYLWATTGVTQTGAIKFDYQGFTLPNLREPNLDEPDGLRGGSELTGYFTSYYCPDSSIRTVPADGPIDWNCDGDTIDTGLVLDINNDGDTTTLQSQNDWENIVFDGDNVIGVP